MSECTQYDRHAGKYGRCKSGFIQVALCAGIDTHTCRTCGQPKQTIYTNSTTPDCMKDELPDWRMPPTQGAFQ